MLWVALIIGAVDSAVDLIPLGLDDAEFMRWMGPVVLAIFVLNGLLIHFTARRRNWARILLMVLIFGSLALYAIWPPELGAEPLREWFGTIIVTVLELTALAMLFSGRGGDWYSKEAAQ